MDIFLNKINHVDCVEGMKLIQGGSIKLTVTSPPYDNLRKYKGYSFNFEEVASELFRVTKDGGVVVWVISDSTKNGSETGTSFKHALEFMKVGFNLHDTMIWVKPNPMPQIKRKRYTNAFEYMFVFSKGFVETCNYLMEPCKNAGKDMSKSSFKNYSKDGGTRLLKNKSVNAKKIQSNVWEIKIGKGSGNDKYSYGHPAVFPEELAEKHILTWSDEGDIVLDPFMGSGTTAKMALLNNRNFIGFEVSAEYVEIANIRIKNAKEAK